MIAEAIQATITGTGFSRGITNDTWVQEYWKKSLNKDSVAYQSFSPLKLHISMVS